MSHLPSKHNSYKCRAIYFIVFVVSLVGGPDKLVVRIRRDGHRFAQSFQLVDGPAVEETRCSLREHPVATPEHTSKLVRNMPPSIIKND